MKTDKQIHILSIEKGKEFWAKSREMDCIFITEENFKEIFKGMDTSHMMMNFTPVLKEGIFCAQSGELKDYIVFLCEIGEHGEICARCDSFQNKADVYRWSYSCVFIVGMEGEDVNIRMEEYEDPSSVIFKKQNLPQKERRYVEENISERTQNFLTFLKVMAWINYLSEHPQLKTVSRKRSTRIFKTVKQNTETVKKGNKRPVTPHVISINGIRIVTADEKTSNSLVRKTPRRIAACWSVRGHYRHYKSGRTIYIHPYKKGKGRISNKMYQL